MWGQRERGGESGELAQEVRLPQCRDEEPRLGSLQGPGVPAEAPESPTSWEKSLGEGHRKQGRYNRDIQTQRDTSCPWWDRASPLLPPVPGAGTRTTSPVGAGAAPMGHRMPGSLGTGEEGRAGYSTAGQPGSTDTLPGTRCMVLAMGITHLGAPLIENDLHVQNFPELLQVERTEG